MKSLLIHSPVSLNYEVKIFKIKMSEEEAEQRWKGFVYSPKPLTSNDVAKFYKGWAETVSQIYAPKKQKEMQIKFFMCKTFLPAIV